MKTVDWPKIEAEYCEGAVSIAQIARGHGISRASIHKRGKAEKWVRAGDTPVTCKPAVTPPVMRPQPAEVGAETDIVLVGRDMARRLLDELDAVTTHRGELADMIKAETAGDNSADRRSAMVRAIDLPTRANTLKAIAASVKMLGEALEPRGKKAARDERAREITSRFRPIGPPTLKSVK